MTPTRVPKPLNIKNDDVVTPVSKYNSLREAVADHPKKTTTVKPLTISAQVVTNITPVTQPVKQNPKPAFKGAGFDINDIDHTLVPIIATHGTFTDAEQARISYIVHHDFKDVLIKRMDNGAEQQATHSQKSHEILLKCLQNDTINQTNQILQLILDIITFDGKSKNTNTWENFFFVGKTSTEPDMGLVINTLNIHTDNVKQKLPQLQEMVSSLKDALFHTTQEYKSLRQYYVAGECKLELLKPSQTAAPASSDPLKIMQQVDDKHNYDLFVRKVNGFKVLVEYITSSLLQAQALQNILESMILNIETMIDINIPAFKQQLLYANSFKNLKSSPVFLQQKTTLINNIKAVLEGK